MKHPIKNIIFDLGGVLFDINYHLTAEAFEKIGVKDFKNIFAKKGQADVIDRLEEGKIGIDELTKELSVLCGINLSKQQVIEAWNVMLFNRYLKAIPKSTDKNLNFVDSSITDLAITGGGLLPPWPFFCLCVVLL